MNDNYNSTANMCMDWDDTIENDGQEFIVLDEGDYNFTVSNFERGRFPGSAKIPACNKATLTLEVKTPEGIAYVKADLILYRTLEWRISSFFRSIGHKKHGERLVMDWNHIIGSRGRAHFKPRTYTGNDGQEFIVLDEGDYNFTVSNFERGRFPGSAKIPACNKATLTLEVKTSEGIAYVKADLILYRTLEWRISSFFRSIGQKKHGERLMMDWNHIVGSRGRAHFKPRTYIGNDGQERKTNDVDYYIDWDEKYFSVSEAGFIEIDDDDELPFN